jgi:dTDP-4-amino-4,6-dideoxygalactose transaminase
MELSKTISSGWGGVLLVNKKKLSKKIEKKYLLLNRETNVKSFLKHFQIFISIICYNKYLYFLGKYFYSLLYKLKIFKPSSLPEEKKGIFKDNFFEKLGRFQIIFAIVQWRSFDKIISKCVKNYNIIFNSLENSNIKVLPVAASNEFLVSNRISFLVKDRKKFTEYFQNNGVSIGKWFDGPLSPSPKSKMFNYNMNEFKSASIVSKKIVNLPCNSSLSDFDCEHIIALLNKYFSKKNDYKS